MEQCKIYCEGPMEGSTCIDAVHRFRNEAMKENHIRDYCSTYDYEKCGYAIYKESTYDDKTPCKKVQAPIIAPKPFKSRNKRPHKKKRNKGKQRDIRQHRNNDIVGQMDMYDWLGQ
jgi:hypothetical protein